MEKLSVAQKSQLLVFLSRFPPNSDLLDLNHVNLLEKHFLETAKESIKQSLQTLGITTKVLNSSLQLIFPSTGNLHILREAVEDDLNQTNRYDSPKQVSEIVQLGKQFLFQFRPYLSKYDALKEQKIEKISTSVIKIDHSQNLPEDSFERTRQYMYFANGSEIYHPDPNFFQENQWKRWQAMAMYPKRGFWDYHYLDHIWPMHEIMHCVRFGVPGDDEIPEFEETEKLLLFFRHGNWFGEFGASFGQLGFLYLVIKQNQNRFLPGFAEECILQFAERIFFHHTQDPKVTEDLKKQYEVWRNSRGGTDPLEIDSTVLNHENNNAYEYYLGRLALEHFDFGKNFGIFLDESFTDWEKEIDAPVDWEKELIKAHTVPSEKIPTKSIESWFARDHKVEGF